MLFFSSLYSGEERMAACTSTDTSTLSPTIWPFEVMCGEVSPMVFKSVWTRHSLLTRDNEYTTLEWTIQCGVNHAGLHQREQIWTRNKTEGTSKCLQVRNDWEVSWSGVFIYKTTTPRSTGSRHPCWAWHKIEAVGEGGSVHPVELTQCFNCDGERILTNLWLPMMCILSTFHCYQITDVG